MRLLELCPEIIVQIGESVDSEQDLLALSRAHPALSTLLTRCLYRLDAEAYGGSELYRAAKRGSLAGVKASLKYGASRYLDDFRLRDSNNDDAEYLGYYKMMTPLMMAAAGGNLEVAQLLLGDGASVEPDLHWSMEGFHQSALHIAMDRGDVRMIRLLVDAGANVEPSATDPRFGPGARRRGPLGRAMEREQEEIAMILLDAGASPQRYTLRGDSMLHIALQMRSMRLVTRLLEKGASPNDSGWLDLSLVKVAVQLESPELLKLLLTHGASSEPSGSWDSMICDAVERGNVEVVECLVNHKRPSDFAQWDCAKVALEGRKYEVFEWLLKYGIVADTRGTKAEDVLVLAIQWDMPDYIRALIELGARLGAREIGEPTLLMILAKAGNFEATQILLSLEAEPESTDMDGRTALFLAVKSMAEMDHVFQTVTILLDAGADPNVVSERGETLLSQVAYAKRLKIAELLLDRGADIDIRNGEGRTALSLAAGRGNKRVVKFLLDHGANPTIVCHQGWAPLDWCSDHYHEIQELLICGVRKWNRAARENQQGC